MKYMNVNYSPIVNKIGQHYHIVAVSLTLVITVVNIFLHWPSKAEFMNSTMLTVNGSGDITNEESIHDPMPYVKHAMKNNHRYKPFFPFCTPFRLIVAGPCGAGRTEFVQ